MKKEKDCKEKPPIVHTNDDPQPPGGGIGGTTCDKTNPNDPHYGQAGYYDADCKWVKES